MLVLLGFRRVARPIWRAAPGMALAMSISAGLASIAQAADDAVRADVPPAPGPQVPLISDSLRLIGDRGYAVRLDGVPDGLGGAFEEVSQLIARKDEPPASIGGLRRRAQSDVTRMNKVLQSRGYFEGTVAYRIDLGLPQSASATPADGTVVPGAAPPVPAPPTQPVEVVVQVDAGPQYVIGDNQVSYREQAEAESVSDSEAALPSDLSAYGIVPGAPAIAADIIAAEKKLVDDLHDRGYPFARSGGRRALADVDSDRLAVTTFVELGARARFGDLTVDGLERVTPGYIDRRKTFEDGEIFDQRKLDDMRAGLVRSGLFDGVRFEVGEAVNDTGEVPVTLTVSERPPRTIGAGASYSSTEGFGISAHWENRNLLGEGQHLRLEARIAQIEQEAEARYRVAGFRRADQTLELGTMAGRESTDIYDRVGGLLTAGIERPLGDKWTGKAGVLFDGAQVDEVGEATETALLFGVPLQATHNGADSLLDPRDGYRLRLAATPYVGRFNDELAFHVADVELRTYVPLDEEKRLVWATRARAGSIVGARTGELPADKRFYAGGAGSVRGFEFQEISPLGTDGAQEGGRSLLEFSNELRWRFMDDLGVVPFIDGGIVTDSPLPDFEEEVAWGGGLGFRYYTSFGPIGVDLAYPIATPSDEEPSLKFYVKLGQAF